MKREYGLKLFFIFPFIIIVLLLLFSCKSAMVEPEPFSLTGRYQDECGYGMIMLLEQTGTHLEGELSWTGTIIPLKGMVDAKQKQILLRDDYGMLISFTLNYDSFKTLAGGMDYQGFGTQAISFKFVDKLNKSLTHNQGQLYGN